MKINTLFVDNKFDDSAIQLMQKTLREHFPGSKCDLITNPIFNQIAIFEHKPDVVIIDVALKENEELYFDKVESGELKFNPEKKITGIEYCLNLKSYFSNLPVLLASRFFHPSILSSAIEAGADGFLYKKTIDEGYFISALKATFFKCKTDDVSFYEKLRELLENEENDVWEREHILPAMDAFFSRGSGSRRLTGLWCNLSELIEELLPSDIVNELLRALIDTEALLLAVNPRMRNHVRHSGNVFWLGYFLLNSIELFKKPERLPQYNINTYKGSNLSPFEQLNLTWILSSLLHDIGYLRERIVKIEDRIQRTYELFSISDKKGNPFTHEIDDTIFLQIRDYLKELQGEGPRLYSAINKTIKDWGQSVKDNLVIEDHGIASAAAFLTSIGKVPGTKIERPEIFHAAT